MPCKRFVLCSDFCSFLITVLTRLVKTLAKPVANRIKVEVRRHPKFSELCTNIGQMMHQVTSRLNVMASGYKILQVEPLAADEALARGINFVSESFIFGVAGGILVFEYQRSEAKSAAKALQVEEENRRYQQYLDDKFQNLYREIKSISTRLDDIETRIEEQEKQRGRWLLGIGSGSGTNSRNNSNSNNNNTSIDRKDPKQMEKEGSPMPQSRSSNEVSNNLSTIDSQKLPAPIQSHSPPAVLEDTEVESTIAVTVEEETKAVDNTTVVTPPSSSSGYWSSWYRWRLW